jgi:preprotein translocase subunit YajC
MAEATAPSGDAPAAQPVPAQSGSTTQPGGPTPTEPTQDFFSNPLIWIVIIVWVWVIFSIRKQKKKDSERRQDMENIKKGDKVVTIGRMHGIVSAVEGDTITLKVDEKTGATIKFDRVAILRPEPVPAAKDEKKDN